MVDLGKWWMIFNYHSSLNNNSKNADVHSVKIEIYVCPHKWRCFGSSQNQPFLIFCYNNIFSKFNFQQYSMKFTAENSTGLSSKTKEHFIPETLPWKIHLVIDICGFEYFWFTYNHLGLAQTLLAYYFY